MSWIARLGRNDTGAVAPTVALSLIGLIAVGGIAFDYAHMATLDTELQSAADQAALAAASQLDGEDGACSRAVEAAQHLVANQSLLANDGQGIAVTIADSGVCTSDTVITDDPDAGVRFFQDKGAKTPSTDMTNARFVEVKVVTRRANYALTPIVGVFNSGDLGASARAGMGTALCKVPPLMICPPNGEDIDWAAMKGIGIQAVDKGKGGWTPGNFGYIGPQDANSTQIGLAFENPVFQCQEINSEQSVSTGGPTPAITAINTRFDIYDMSGGGGQALTPCLGSSCPPALNVTKDFINIGAPVGDACKMSNSGWRLPASNRQFAPVQKTGTDPLRSFQKAGQPIDAMGLPRDNCHYDSYGATCAGGRFGDGNWARGDYFAKNHPGGERPPNPSTVTRYETYRWEIDNAAIPNQIVSGSGASALRQNGRPVCNGAIPDSTRDRRVLQVAVGSNCGDLKGASTKLKVSGWVNMFLVEPGGPAGGNGRGNGDPGNAIYLEVIGPTDPGGATAQVIRRDTPYLVR